MQATNAYSERRLQIMSASIDQLYKMASINPRVDMKRRELIDILLEEDEYAPSAPHVVESDEDDEDDEDDVYDYMYSDDEDV